MRRVIYIRRVKDRSKPHKQFHIGCCEYLECLLWQGELLPMLKRARTDVQQIR